MCLLPGQELSPHPLVLEVPSESGAGLGVQSLFCGFLHPSRKMSLEKGSQLAVLQQVLSLLGPLTVLEEETLEDFISTRPFTRSLLSSVCLFRVCIRTGRVTRSLLRHLVGSAQSVWTPALAWPLQPHLWLSLLSSHEGRSSPVGWSRPGGGRSSSDRVSQRFRSCWFAEISRIALKERE